MCRQKQKSYVDLAFATTISEGHTKDKVTCTACNKYTISGNVTRQKHHLEICEAYYNAKARKGISNDATRVFEKNNPTKVISQPGLQQTKITDTTMSKPKPAAEFDEVVALAAISGARPFTLFEPEDMQTAVEAIKKAPRTRKAPNRKKLAGKLLKQVFDFVKEQVDEHIKQASFLNFTVDETTDITQTRIVNMRSLAIGQNHP
ncbi:hypothetical protein E4U19_006825 [Claviceps sp. Clav32 group G5]|nr:hypothetical protein E4U19_006825 [Claviceps sp. Clav32 group G5]KAG6049921.1 hypothetical protein E4U39_005264 [Claviceps sp. Clav50 group G5]